MNALIPLCFVAFSGLFCSCAALRCYSCAPDANNSCKNISATTQLNCAPNESMCHAVSYELPGERNDYQATEYRRGCGKLSQTGKDDIKPRAVNSTQGNLCNEERLDDVIKTICYCTTDGCNTYLTAADVRNQENQNNNNQNNRGNLGQRQGGAILVARDRQDGHTTPQPLPADSSKTSYSFLNDHYNATTGNIYGPVYGAKETGYYNIYRHDPRNPNIILRFPLLQWWLANDQSVSFNREATVYYPDGTRYQDNRIQDQKVIVKDRDQTTVFKDHDQSGKADTVVQVRDNRGGRNDGPQKVVVTNRN